MTASRMTKMTTSKPDKQREAFQAEINRLEDAKRRSTSEHLRRDYGKALRRMRAELREYDRYKQEARKA